MEELRALHAGIKGWEVVQDPKSSVPHQLRTPERPARNLTLNAPPAQPRRRARRRNPLRSPSPVLPSLQLTSSPIPSWDIFDLDEEFASMTPTRIMSSPATRPIPSNTISPIPYSNPPLRDRTPRPVMNQEVTDLLSPTLRYSTETVGPEVIWGELMDIERSVAREVSNSNKNGRRPPSINTRRDVTRQKTEKAKENGIVKREMISLSSGPNGPTDVPQISWNSRDDKITNSRMALMEVFAEERDDTEYTASRIAAEVLLSLEKAVAPSPNASNKSHNEHSIHKVYEHPIAAIAPEPTEEAVKDPLVSDMNGLPRETVQETSETGTEMETVKETGLHNGEVVDEVLEEETIVSRNDESMENVNPAQSLEITIPTNTASPDKPLNRLSEPSATEPDLQKTHSTSTTAVIPFPEVESQEYPIHHPSPSPQTHPASQSQPQQPSLILTVSIPPQALKSLLNAPKQDLNATPQEPFTRPTPFATLDESTALKPGVDLMDNDLQDTQVIPEPQGDELDSQGIIAGVDNFGIEGDEEGVGNSSGKEGVVTLSQESDHPVDEVLITVTEIESEKESSKIHSTHKFVAINREVEEVLMEDGEGDMDDESVDQGGTVMEEVIMDEKQVFTKTQVDQSLAEISESRQVGEQDIALKEGERQDGEVVHGDEMQIDGVKGQETSTIAKCQLNGKIPVLQDELPSPSPSLPEHERQEMRQQDIEEKANMDEVDEEVSESTISNQPLTETNPPPTLEPSTVDDIISSPPNTSALQNKIATEVTSNPPEKTVHKTQPLPEDTETSHTEKATGHLHRIGQSILSSRTSEISEDEFDEGMITLSLHELQDTVEGEEDVGAVGFRDGNGELEDVRQSWMEIPRSVSCEKDEGRSDTTDIGGENRWEECEEKIAQRSGSAGLTSGMEVQEESESSIGLSEILEESDGDNGEQSKEILPVPSESFNSPSPSRGSKSQKGTFPPLTIPNPPLVTSKTFPSPTIQREVSSTSSPLPSRTTSRKHWTAPIPSPELPRQFSHLHTSPRSLIARVKLPRQSSKTWSAPIPVLSPSVPELSFGVAGIEENLAVGSSPVVLGVKEMIQDECSRNPEISLDNEAKDDEVDIVRTGSIEVDETMDMESAASEGGLPEMERDGLITSTSVSLDGTDNEDCAINRENPVTKESIKDEMSPDDLETETDNVMDSDSGPHPEIAAPNSLTSNSMETMAMQDCSMSPTNPSFQESELSPAPTASTAIEKQETPPTKGRAGTTLSDLGTQSLSSPRPTPSPSPIVSSGPSVRRISIEIPIPSRSPSRPRVSHNDSTPADQSPTTSSTLSPTYTMSTPSMSPSDIPDRRLKFKLKFHEPDTPPLASPSKRRKSSKTDDAPQPSPSKPSVLKSETSKPLLRTRNSKVTLPQTAIPQSGMLDCIVVRTDFENVSPISISLTL